MIGIDLSFIFPMEVKKGYLYRSYELATAAVLDGLVDLHLESDFVLIVNHYTAKFVQQRFPEYKICTVCFPLSDLVYCLTNGQKAANTWGKKCGEFKKAVKRSGVELLWYPCGLPENMGDCDIPYVCTVNDIINFHETNDENLKGQYRKMILESKQIVTISDFVKDDVVSSFGYNGDLVETIPVCIQKPTCASKNYEHIKTPFILDINGYGPHKNTFTLIKAFENIKDEVSQNLVLCGGWKDENYYSTILNYIKEKGLEERILVLYSVPNDQRNWLLYNADLFVTPSLNEGFGMTPVEAAMCCVPVISTKVSSLYEVTLGSVNYVENPEDVKELAALIEKVLKNPPSKEYLQSLSVNLIERYKASSCALRYWELFQTCIK